MLMATARRRSRSWPPISGFRFEARKLVAPLLRQQGQLLSHGTLGLELEAMEDPGPLGEQLHAAGLAVA